MTDLAKIVVPLILTAVGIFMYDMYQDIGVIQKRLNENNEYVYRLERLETKMDNITKIKRK